MFKDADLHSPELMDGISSKDEKESKGSMTDIQAENIDVDPKQPPSEQTTTKNYEHQHNQIFQDESGHKRKLSLTDTKKKQHDKLIS